MATSGERRALMFLAAVAVLGAGTRAIRARQAPTVSAELDLQIHAVDSVGNGSTDRRIGRSAGRRPRKSATARQSDNPPIRQPEARIDIDRATAEEIERLPGIGPALARRIVSDRDSLGPFGCLAALDAVKGIGPAMLRRLDTLALFSGAGRPACSGATSTGPGGEHEQQEYGDGDDDHPGKLVRMAGGWECPASPSSAVAGGDAGRLYPGPGFGGTFYS